METDPDVPGYRYPEPGERLWHRSAQRWVVVREDNRDLRVLDEVAVTFEGSGNRTTVKLRSLVPTRPPDRFDADPDECAANGGHDWRDSNVVIDTAPPTYTQTCATCPAYRERGGFGENRDAWSEPQVHPRFRRARLELLPDGPMRLHDGTVIGPAR